MSALTTESIWQIPPSVMHWQARAPDDAAVAVLLRHSVRDALPSGHDESYVLPITADGVSVARELGAVFGRRLRSLHSSPLARCMQTAEALSAGAGVELAVREDRLLGDPGAYVLDGERAWSNWLELGHEGVMAHLVGENEPLPGMAAPEAAARFLVQHMLAAAGAEPGFHVFVTHDSLVLATAVRLLGDAIGLDAGVWFLEGAFFWRQDGGVTAAYQAAQRHHPGASLCRLDELDVIELARREVARTVGLRCPARFFLAGGAFKTLLTGRPPRDLDLWAPSGEDRAMLIETLEARGARRLPPQPYADGFEIGDRIVEVPHRTEPPTLAERLARFDLGLSAIGAEHRPGDRWRALIDPLALASVARREVLLLKPLVNWRHALATLERMRRYADELGYVVPESEEAEVWRVFEAQTAEMQQGMLERFERTTMACGRRRYVGSDDRGALPIVATTRRR